MSLLRDSIRTAYYFSSLPLRSYAKPLIIMSAIPFGALGAMLGHLILGYPLSFPSLLGIVALAGVVVNDSLVMVDFINREVARGGPLLEAVKNAGVERFRAVSLTASPPSWGWRR